MIRISIVTSSLNQAPFLEEMLASVQQQSYRCTEHIVFDGGSQDGTVEQLQEKRGPEWQHLHWRSERDQGQSSAMNKGFRCATGDVIGWLNADDRYRPGCFEAVARAFDENPEVDVLYGDYSFIDAAGKHLRTRREIEFSRFILFYHRVLYIPTTSTFFRRRIFDRGNFLDESLHYAMDHEFYARLAKKSYRFRHLREVLADFRMHPASKTGSMPSRQLEESRMVMYRHSPRVAHLEPKAARTVCFAGLRVAAALARYTEKLFRGYYLPDSVGHSR